MTYRFRALLALVFIIPVRSQTFLAGVKAGVPVTDYFETGASGGLHGGGAYSSATRRYTVGASVEWHLTNAFGFEVDGMFHRLGYSASIYVFPGNGYFQDSAVYVAGDSWDFPLVAKYRFGRVIRLSISGGGVLRYIGPVHLNGVEASGNLAFSNSPTATTTLSSSDPTDLAKRFYPGITLAEGVEFPVGRFRLVPELRYTRWTANIAGSDGVLRFAPNQVEVLLGVSF